MKNCIKFGNGPNIEKRRIGKACQIEEIVGRLPREYSSGKNAKISLHGHIIRVKKKGRPRKRWLQVVEQEIGKMRTRGWKWKAQGRDE